MVTTKHLLSIILAVSPVACLAIVGPPYTTDDPEPVEFGHYEAYVASQYFHLASGVSGTGPHFEFNFGAAQNLQLHLITPMAYNNPSDGSPSNYGFGDTELGVKYRFVQESAHRPMVGVFPLVEIPTGSANRGLGNGQAQFFLPVWVQKTFGAWSSYGGGGYWHNPGTGNRDYWFFGLQAQNQVTKQLSLGAELYHSTVSTVGGSDKTGFNLGAVYDIDEGHHILLSAGRSFAGESQTTGYVAFQWTFGPKEKK